MSEKVSVSLKIVQLTAEISTMNQTLIKLTAAINDLLISVKRLEVTSGR